MHQILSVYATNTNVNNLSSNSTLSINGHTIQISNLNSTQQQYLIIWIVYLDNHFFN